MAAISMLLIAAPHRNISSKTRSRGTKPSADVERGVLVFEFAFAFANATIRWVKCYV
jgi:hypothetical protein